MENKRVRNNEGKKWEIENEIGRLKMENWGRVKAEQFKKTNKQRERKPTRIVERENENKL